MIYIYLVSTFMNEKEHTRKKFIAWTKKWTANKFEYNLIFWKSIFFLYFITAIIIARLRCRCVKMYVDLLFHIHVSSTRLIFNLYYDFNFLERNCQSDELVVITLGHQAYLCIGCPSDFSQKAGIFLFLLRKSGTLQNSKHFPWKKQDIEVFRQDVLQKS
jgi:hypothetical protein